MNLNLALVAGRLVADPDFRYTPSGKQVVTFRVAVNEGYGEKKMTEYINCEAWESQAKRMEDARKGTSVIVRGVITTQSWEKDGKKQYKTFVKAIQADAMTPVVSEQQPRQTTVIDDDIPF